MFSRGFPQQSAACLAQSVEHQTFNLRVKGSSPLMGYRFLSPFPPSWWNKKPENKTQTSLGGLEPPTFRLTVERANRLRHWDTC